MILKIKKLKSKIFLNQSDIQKKHQELELTSLRDCNSNSVFWLKSLSNYGMFTQGNLILTMDDMKEIKQNNLINKNINYLICEKNLKARLAFCILLNECLPKIKFEDETKKHKKNKKIKLIGSVLISNNVKIGEGTVIYPNVVIHPNVTIGKNCIVRENTSLGGPGMGFEKNLDSTWLSFPQVGNLIIGNDVEIGSHCDIKRGAIESTMIGDNCKFGSFINVGHNSIIGENSLFTNHCVVAGSVKIGYNFFMGINSSIKNGITIGNNVTVAANSFINENVGDNQLTFGVNKKINTK